MGKLVEVEWTTDTHLKEFQRGPDPGNDADAEKKNFQNWFSVLTGAPMGEYPESMSRESQIQGIPIWVG